MKAKLRGMMIVSILLCVLSVQSMAEVAYEFPENIRMAADAEISVPAIAAGQQVPLFPVTLCDFQELIVPSLFPDGMISEVEVQAVSEGSEIAGEISIGYWFNDGSYLYLYSSRLGMMWEGENASQYHQLLRYLYDHDVSIGRRELDFMSPDEAVELCGGLLERLGLHDLMATAVWGLSGDDIALYSDRMAAEYSDMKLERFSHVTDHDAVYCVEFRSVFDAIPTVRNAPFPSYGGAQCLFLIREDGPVMMDISGVIERFDTAGTQPVAVALEDALRLFCEGKDVARSDADDYEITRISYGYAESAGSVSAGANGQITYVPHYQIDYLYTLHFGDQETRIPCEILINALDGSIIKVRGV